MKGSPTRGARLVIGASVCLAMATVVLVTAPTASARQATSEKPIQALQIPERMRKQIPLTQAASLIRAEIERGDYSGYTGIELEDNERRRRWCTTGFPVQNGSFLGEFLLTAAHCVRLDDSVRDGAGEHLGTVVRDNDVHRPGLCRRCAPHDLYRGS